MVQWWRVAVEGAWRVAFMHSSITMQISQVLLWHNTWTPYFLPYFLPCHSHVYTQCQSIASQNIRCLGHNDTFNRLHQIPSKCAYISIVTFETFATHSTRHFHTSPLSNWLPFGSDMGGTSEILYYLRRVVEGGGWMMRFWPDTKMRNYYFFFTEKIISKTLF